MQEVIVSASRITPRRRQSRLCSFYGSRFRAGCITVSGADFGNDTFGLNDYVGGVNISGLDNFILDTNGGTLELTQELVGQPTADDPYGTTFNGTSGGFGITANDAGEAAGAPTGGDYFEIYTKGELNGLQKLHLTTCFALNGTVPNSMRFCMKRQLPCGLIMAAASAAYLTLGAPAHAQLTTYTLSGVSFNIDGSGTVAGFFEYDPTLQTFGNFSLTTSDGTGADFPNYIGSTYDPTNTSAPSVGNGKFDFLSNDGSMVLDLTTSTPVGVSGTYTLTKSEEDLRTEGFGGTVVISNYRDGNIGTITASGSPVPEASTTASLGLLLIFGMGGLVVAAKRKKPANQA